jgi:hypothetical protein
MMHGSTSLEAPPSPSESSVLPSIAPEIATHISSLQDDINDVLKTRLVASFLEEPAALVVKTLQTIDTQLPSRAWGRFLKADGVVIFLTRSISPEDLQKRLQQVVAAFPDTLTRITIQHDEREEGELREVEALELQPFFEALLASKLAGSITELVVTDVCMTAKTAAMVLQGFHALEVFNAAVSHAISQASSSDSKHVTISTFPPGLKSCNLQIYPPNCEIDASGLGLCANLNTLNLLAVTIHNLEAIAACKSLHHLTIDPMMAASRCDARNQKLKFMVASLLDAITQLPELCSFMLPQVNLPLQQWNILAGVRTIRTVDIGAPLFHPSRAAAAAARCITMTTVKEEPQQLQEAPYDSCLSRMLPEADNLTIACDGSRYSLIAESLRGHEKLSSLTIMGIPSEAEAEWPHNDFRTIAHLKSFCIEGANTRCLEHMIADVSGCPGLQDFTVICDAFEPFNFEMQEGGEVDESCKPVITPGAVRALAQGACRGSLKSVVLAQTAASEHSEEGVRVGVEDLAVLLCPGLAELAELAIDVNMPLLVGSGDEAASRRRLVETFQQLLAAAGVAAADMHGFEVADGWGYDLPGPHYLPVVRGSVRGVQVHARLWQVERA